MKVTTNLLRGSFSVSQSLSDTKVTRTGAPNSFVAQMFM